MMPIDVNNDDAGLIISATYQCSKVNMIAYLNTIGQLMYLLRKK